MTVGTPVHDAGGDRAPLLRPARTDDALCIGVLGTQVFLDTYATEGVRPVLAREALARFSSAEIADLLARPDTRFIVAERDAHLVGFVQVTLGARQPEVAGSVTAEVARLYVQRRFQGQRLGTRLLHSAQAMAAEAGATRLWLTAWVGNPRAIGFYAAQGWQDVGSTDYVFEGEAFLNRIFVRELAAD